MKEVGWIALAAVLFAMSATFGWVKRTAPPEVKPIVYEGTEYIPVYKRILGEHAGMEAFISAKDVRNHDEIFRAPLYRIHYKSGLETDVQDDFVSHLWVYKGQIAIQTEGGSQFLLDTNSRKAWPLKTPSLRVPGGTANQ